MFAFVNFKEILWYSVTKPVWNYYEPKLRWELELSWSFCYEWKFHCEVDLTTWESKVSCNLTFRYTRSFKNVFAIIAPPPLQKKKKKERNSAYANSSHMSVLCEKKLNRHKANWDPLVVWHSRRLCISLFTYEQVRYDPLPLPSMRYTNTVRDSVKPVP